MNKTERLDSVLELLSAHGEVDIEQLAEFLDVSAATVRRDLDSLATQKLATRTRGGARAQPVDYDLPLRYKRDVHSPEKQRIAAAASDLIAPGMVIGLSGGTTTTAIAIHLASRPDLDATGPVPSLTIVTNAINIAAQLAIRPHIKTVVTGGVVNTRSYELAGALAGILLSRLTIDIAFIGVNAIDPARGPAMHDEDEAGINLLMAQRARSTVIVTDSSKIGQTAFASLDSLSLNFTLITDTGITPTQRDAFTERNIDIIAV